MGKNRIESFLRDPTLEQPQTDFFRVRLEWESILVDRETATRILAAMSGPGPPKMIRCETITGSVVFVRTDTIVLVRECTKAQRDAERKLWKELDNEEEEDPDDPFRG